MGKGRHQMDTKEELIKKYNQINRINQVQSCLSKRWPVAWISSYLFVFTVFILSFLVLGTAGSSQVSAKQESKLHCSLWRYISDHNLDLIIVGIILGQLFCKYCLHVLPVITSKDLQKHGNIWVCPIPDHVCTRFLFVWVLQQKQKYLHIFSASQSYDSFQIILQVCTPFCFCLFQIWERSGGRCSHRHRGGQDPQGHFTSNCFKAVLRKQMLYHKSADFIFIYFSHWLK